MDFLLNVYRVFSIVLLWPITLTMCSVAIVALLKACAFVAYTNYLHQDKFFNRIVMRFYIAVNNRLRRFRMAGVEFHVFPLTFNVVLITLKHYCASVR